MTFESPDHVGSDVRYDTRCVVRGVSELYTPERRVENAAFALANGRFAWVGAARDLPAVYADWPATDLHGRAVIPGLVDSHTHLVWAGSRVAEYASRSEGADYRAIMAAGGGILSTVAATRSASGTELTELARRRADTFLRGGVVALEVKSGYGLSTEHELRMLEVVRRLSGEGPQRMTATLLAHLPDPAVPRETYLDRFVTETLPEAARRGLANAVDVFCDEGAFTLGETREIFEAALARGLKVKAHAEQLSHTGAARLVAEYGGLSADHLERATRADLDALAEAGSVATLLPLAALLLKTPLPPVADLRGSGVKVAIASDHNPGSSPAYGLLPALRLGIATVGLSAREALMAGTATAADALARHDWGRIEPGAVADYLVVDGAEALTPLYTWGTPSLREVVIGGEVAWRTDA